MSSQKIKPGQIQRSSSAVPVHLPPWVTEFGAGHFRIDAWGLEAPELEYVADGCELQSIGGVPVIYFWQQGPSGAPASFVAVSMAPGQLQEILASFEEIRKHLADRLAVWYDNATVPTADLGSVPPERHRRFMANVLRAASSEHSAMLDFYSIELYTLQRLRATSGGIPPKVRDLLRVWVSPPVLSRLLALLDAR